MDPMNIYGDIFAEVYNLYWTEYIDIVGPQIIAIYEQLHDIGKEKPRILDLCCGTGRLAIKFLEQGYSLIGIDLSPDMIEVAKRKTKREQEEGRASFRVGNAIDFEIEEKVPLVISTFDSMNHMSNYNELESCFRQVYRSLEEGGIFIFDLNTEKGLKQWEFVDFEENESATFIMHGKYNRKERKAYTKVIGFRKKGDCYVKFEETMYNTIFKISKVLDLLQHIGFDNIMTTSEMDLTQIVDNPENEDRTFIICRKKG